MQSARGFEYGVRHIISPRSGEIIDVLLSTLELDQTQIEFLLALGSVYLNHKRVKENSSVSAGDYLRVHTKPRRFAFDHINWRERILFESDDFIVVNKISGIPVHASVDNDKEHLLFHLAKTLQCELYVTHRLDVPTRGLLVYAKTLQFQSEFNKMLLQKETTKIYRARVQGRGLKTGLLTHYMEPSPRAPKKVSREPQEGWQECLLEILDVHELEGDISELKIHLLTGRTHQIRAQLGCEGFPIVGDHAYGGKKISDGEQIELEACELSFVHPLESKSYHFKI